MIDYADAKPKQPLPSLREFVLRSIDRPQEPRLRISQAGKDCVREVFYQATGAPQSEPPKDEGRIKMALGSAFDAYALTIHAGHQHDWEFQIPVEVTIGSITVRGTADAVLYASDPVLHERLLHVADLKTVGSKTWAKVQNSPKKEHRAQVQLYAYGLGAPSWSVLYINADTGEQIEHYGQTDEFEARADFGLFEEATYWMNRGEPPPRPYADQEDDEGNTTKRAVDGYPCAWCSYKTTCWQGASNVESVQATRTK